MAEVRSNAGRSNSASVGDNGWSAQSYKIKFGNITRSFFAVSLPATGKGRLIE